jgi:hypothetical protein
MTIHEYDDQIIEGELGSSYSLEEFVGNDIGLHQFFLLELAHIKQCRTRTNRAHTKHQGPHHKRKQEAQKH